MRIFFCRLPPIEKCLSFSKRIYTYKIANYAAIQPNSLNLKPRSEGRIKTLPFLSLLQLTSEKREGAAGGSGRSAPLSPQISLQTRAGGKSAAGMPPPGRPQRAPTTQPLPRRWWGIWRSPVVRLLTSQPCPGPLRPPREESTVVPTATGAPTADARAQPPLSTTCRQQAVPGPRHRAQTRRRASLPLLLTGKMKRRPATGMIGRRTSGQRGSAVAALTSVPGRVRESPRREGGSPSPIRKTSPARAARLSTGAAYPAPGLAAPPGPAPPPPTPRRR